MYLHNLHMVGLESLEQALAMSTRTPHTEPRPVWGVAPVFDPPSSRFIAVSAAMEAFKARPARVRLASSQVQEQLVSWTLHEVGKWAMPLSERCRERALRAIARLYSASHCAMDRCSSDTFVGSDGCDSTPARRTCYWASPRKMPNHCLGKMSSSPG